MKRHGHGDTPRRPAAYGASMPHRRSAVIRGQRAGFRAPVHGPWSLLTLLCIVLLAGAASCARTASMSLPELVQREAGRSANMQRPSPPPPGVDQQSLAGVDDADPRAAAPLEEVAAQLAERARTPATDDAAPAQGVSEVDRQRALRHYAAGRSRRLSGDAAGAIEDLRRAIEADPGAAEPYRELGEAHMARGDRLAAVAAFREALRRDPDDLRSLIEVGLASADRGDAEGAAAALSRVWLRAEESVDPALPFIVGRRLGDALLEMGHVRAGAEALRRAASLPESFTHPTSMRDRLADVYRSQSDLWLRIGDARARLGRFEEALEAYQRAGAFPTFNPGALLPRRVYAAMRLGRPATAATAVLASLVELEGRADHRHFQLIAYLREESDVGPALARELERYTNSIESEERRLVESKLLRARAAALPTPDAVALLREQLSRRPHDDEAVEALYQRLRDAGSERLLRETLSLIEQAPMQEPRYSQAMLGARPDPEELLASLRGGAGAGASAWARDLLASRLLLESGQLEQAEATLRELTREERPSPAAASMLAEAMVLAGRSAEAADALEMLEGAAEPSRVRARARILRLMGRYAAALDALSPLLDTTAEAPPAPGDLLLAGQLASRIERFEQAEHHYRLAIELDPAFEEAHAGLIGLYAPGGPLEDRAQFTEAMRRLREIAPSSRTIRWLRAQDLVAGGQYAEAERELLSLAEEQATESIAGLLTTLWLRTGEHDRAESWLREKRAQAPGDPVFVEQLGRVLAETDRAEEAAALLRAWMEERPGDVGVSRRLETILRQRLGRVEEANRLAMERLERSPASLSRSLEMASILVNRGELTAAAQTLQEALALGDPLNDAQRDALVRLAGSIGQRAMEADDQRRGVAIMPEAASSLIEAVAARVGPLPGPMHASRVGLLIGTGAETRMILDAMRRARRDADEIGEQLTVWAMRRLDDAGRPMDALRVVEAGVEATPEPGRELVGAWLQQSYSTRVPDSSVRAIRAAHDAGLAQQFVQPANNQPMPPDEAAAELAYTFAVTMASENDDEGAQALYELALDYDPRHAMTNNNLGYAMADRGENLDEAHRMLMIAYEERPDDGAVVDSLGWVRYKLGIFEDEVDEDGAVVRAGALSLLRRAVDLPESRTDPVVQDHLGDALWLTGQREEAQRRWTMAERFIDAMDPSLRQLRPEIAELEQSITRKLTAVEEGEEPPVASVEGPLPKPKGAASAPGGSG